MNYKLFIFYFITGGMLLSGIMYAGSLGKGYIAAFFAMLPIWTLVPFYLLFFQNGIETALNFAQGLILLTVPWLLYVSTIIWFAPYIGLLVSTMIGFSVFIGCSVLINWLRKL